MKRLSFRHACRKRMDAELATTLTSLCHSSSRPLQGNAIVHERHSAVKDGGRVFVLPVAEEGIAGNLQRSENRRNSVSPNDSPGTAKRPRRGSGRPAPSAAAFMLCCCHADRGRFFVSFNNCMRRLFCLSCGPACDAAELIICQQHLIRCDEPVRVLICLRLFELLLSAQALCDVTEFHVMASPRDRGRFSVLTA